MNIGGTTASGKVLQNIIITRIAMYVQMCNANIFLGIGLLKNNKTIKYAIRDKRGRGIAQEVVMERLSVVVKTANT